MSVLVNVRMPNIMRTPIKSGISTYATYANCRTLFNVYWQKRKLLVFFQENYDLFLKKVF